VLISLLKKRSKQYAIVTKIKVDQSNLSGRALWPVSSVQHDELTTGLACAQLSFFVIGSTVSSLQQDDSLGGSGAPQHDDI